MPLECPAISGHEGVVSLLPEHDGVDAGRLDKQGCAPLPHATRRGHGGVVKLLQTRKSLERAEPQQPDLL